MFTSHASRNVKNPKEGGGRRREVPLEMFSSRMSADMEEFSCAKKKRQRNRIANGEKKTKAWAFSKATGKRVERVHGSKTQLWAGKCGLRGGRRQI